MAAPIGLPEALGTILPRVPSAGNAPSPTEAPGVTPFADRVRDLVAHTDETNRAAEHMASDFADGKHNDIHGTMIAMQKADVTFRLLANVRNRAIEAYHEIMRMGA